MHQWLITFISRHRTIIVIALSLIFAGVLLSVAYHFDHPESKSKTVALILLGVGTSISATFAAKLLETQLTGYIQRAVDQRFEEFFGKGSLTRQNRGVVLLQSDNINSFMQTLLGKDSSIFAAVKESLGNPNRNRMFKARDWVNTHDMEGARIIRDKIRSLGFPTPDVDIIHDSQDDPFKDHKDVPYIISMGLGFTKTSIELAKLCDASRFTIVGNSPKGDAIAYREHAFGFEDMFEGVKIDKERLPPGVIGEWCWLFPKGWKIDLFEDEHITKNKVQDTGQSEKGHETGVETTNDYAVIIRCRVGEQVRFLMAGFTEHTTVKAGEYLVEKWEFLWRRFVYKKNVQNFVVVVDKDKNNLIQVVPSPEQMNQLNVPQKAA